MTSATEEISSPFDVHAFLEMERAAIEAALRRVGASLFAPLPPAIAEPIRYALEAGGKRLRPILCVAAYRAAGGSARDEPLHDFAVPFELIHTYSLIHDDLPSMDDDELRRGRPTVHRVYGSAAATVAGTALIPLAVAALAQAGRRMGLAAATMLASIAELSRAAGAGGMVGGQALDLAAEGRTLSLDELRDLHARKTGALFAAACRVGALAAAAGPALVDDFGRFGDKLGLAFQIADDVLDETGRADVLGKSAGRDRALEKSTFPRLLGIGTAGRNAAHAADEAIVLLRDRKIASPELEALARFAVERDR